MAERLARVKDLRALPEADIQAQLVKLRQDIWQQRIKSHDGSLQQSHHISILKRQIARIHTVLREQQMSQVVSETPRQAVK